MRAAATGDSLGDVTGRRQALLAGGAALGGLLLPGGTGAAAAAELASPPATDSIYDLSALMYGEEVPLERYRGKVGAPLGPLPGSQQLGASGEEGPRALPLHGRAGPQLGASHSLQLHTRMLQLIMSLQVLLVVNVASE